MIWILIAGAYVCSATSLIAVLWRRTPPIGEPMPDFDDFSEAQTVWFAHAAKIAQRRAS